MRAWLEPRREDPELFEKGVGVQGQELDDEDSFICSWMSQLAHEESGGEPREWAQKETANAREWDGEDAAEQFKSELEDMVWCLSSVESIARKMSCADSIRGR